MALVARRATRACPVASSRRTGVHGESRRRVLGGHHEEAQHTPRVRGRTAPLSVAPAPRGREHGPPALRETSIPDHGDRLPPRS
jgi:hypothetical protein